MLNLFVLNSSYHCRVIIVVSLLMSPGRHPFLMGIGGAPFQLFSTKLFTLILAILYLVQPKVRQQSCNRIFTPRSPGERCLASRLWSPNIRCLNWRVEHSW